MACGFALARRPHLALLASRAALPGASLLHWRSLLNDETTQSTPSNSNRIAVTTSFGGQLLKDSPFFGSSSNFLSRQAQFHHSSYSSEARIDSSQIFGKEQKAENDSAPIEHETSRPNSDKKLVEGSESFNENREGLAISGSNSDEKVVEGVESLNANREGSAVSDERSREQTHAGGKAGPSGQLLSPEGFILVDRSGLEKELEHLHGQIPGKEEETPLAKHLKTLIRFRGGPITVAEYMKEVLTNPRDGFYMKQDVFGTKGDFVTSPDISQMFGELLGIWAVVMWQQMGQPREVNLVELGPGRGALMADLLRGTSQFGAFTSSLRVHLVEVSPALRQLQRTKLECQGLGRDSSSPKLDANAEPAVSAISGVPVTWHSSLEDVPRGPLIVIGHEFLDALPVHQFQHTELGWCERLVDVAPDWSQRHLRLVLSKGPTVAAKVYLKKRLETLSLAEQKANPVIEVCPGAVDLTKELSRRIGEDGGGALLIDYGDDKLAGDSLQAIKEHKFVDLLHAPGQADLSAWVDFAAVKTAVAESGADVRAFGPITQTQLLAQLGINTRVEKLLENATEEEADALEEAYLRLVGDQPGNEAAGTPPGMGAKYKALVISKKGQGVPFPFT